MIPRSYTSWTYRTLLALALAGCGDNGNTSATSSTSGDTTTTTEASTSGGSSGAPTTTDTTAAGSSGGSSGSAGPTFADVQAIFSAKCSCHLTAPGVGNGQMELTEGKAYANIVGVKSTEATMTNRIEPGDPTMSYLYLKLTMMFMTVPGGVPDPMPLVGGPLPPDQVTIIEDWILAGAPNN